MIAATLAPLDALGNPGPVWVESATAVTTGHSDVLCRKAGGEQQAFVLSGSDVLDSHVTATIALPPSPAGVPSPDQDFMAADVFVSVLLGS